MDVRHPIRCAVPSLDGPVLTVLARADRAMTGAEVHRLAGTGSVNGVRRVLARLAHEGLLDSDGRGGAIFYRANRDHLAWSAVEVLANLRRSLVDRLRGELRAWQVRPVHGSLFGSMARGDGDVDSDVDILLLRPDQTAEEDAPWSEQTDRLRTSVESWTGNRCHILQLDAARLDAHLAARDPLIDELRRDAITLDGMDFRSLLRRSSLARGRRP